MERKLLSKSSLLFRPGRPTASGGILLGVSALTQGHLPGTTELPISHTQRMCDEMEWNPEWSRRAKGFPTYAALRQLGRAGWASVVENGCRPAHLLVTRIGGLRPLRKKCSVPAH